MTEVTTVYTDGACSGNPGPGGWAWIVPDGPFASGYDPETTNQRMELTAVLEATRRLDGPLHVVSDSTYVVNCFRDGWWEGWLKRGWVNSAKKPVANRDLWEPLIAVYRQRSIDFSWVKGHSGDRWNDLADQLAVEAIQVSGGRAGDETPTLGAVPATPASRGGPTAPIEGHALLVSGHQPPEIGGYDPNPIAARLTAELERIIAAKAELHPDLVVVSGLRLGAEQLGAEAALAVGVPLVAVLPYPDPDERWPDRSRRRFAELVTAAREVRVLQRSAPADPKAAAAAMTRRDAWLARTVDEAIVVWNGSDRRVSRLVRSLEAALGDDVWVLEPRS